MNRKIAAIFVADVAQYSRLMAEDEEETLQRLTSYREVIDAFIEKASGRIFNTAGDAVLAEFPSAVNAVRCAVDIQESLRTRNMAYLTSKQMIFRIGITIGDVVENEKGDLLGEGVNIAARLASLANVGGICISRAAHEQVASKVSVQFTDIGEQFVKNIPTPVHAYTIAVPGEIPRAKPDEKSKDNQPIKATLNALQPAAQSRPASHFLAERIVGPFGRIPEKLYWSVFTLSLIAGGFLMLFACALTLPAFLGLNYCPTPIDMTENKDLEAKSRQLQTEIDKLELQRAAIPPCATCDPNAPVPGQGGAGAPSNEFVLALDVSGSMNSNATDNAGRDIVLPNGSKMSKFELVKRDLPLALDGLGSRNVTFIPFPVGSNSCDVGVPSRSSGRVLASRIRSPDMKAIGGGSPLEMVINESLKVLKKGPDGKLVGNILIITDTGPGECPPEDVCGRVERLHQESPGIIINVVDVGNAAPLRCVTDKTGGKFFARGSQVDLKDMIREAQVFKNPDCPPDTPPASPPRRS